MFNKSNRRAGRGFTITEILIAVLLVLILSAIAVPRLLGNQRQADDTAAKAQLRTAAEVARNLMYEAGGDFNFADHTQMGKDEPNIQFVDFDKDSTSTGNRRSVSVERENSNKEWVAAVVGGDNDGSINCWFIKLDNGSGNAKGADRFAVEKRTSGCKAMDAPANDSAKWELYDFPNRP